MKLLQYSAVFSLLVALSTGCLQNGQFGIRGEGPVIERKVTLEKFSAISLPGSAKIYLTQGPVQEVKIVGQENIIENLNVDVMGGKWDIDNKRSVWQSETLKIYITMETIREIEISGSGDIELMNHFTDLKDLKIRISGSGRMDLDMDVRDVAVNISGSGDLFMKGSAKNLDLRITGAGNISAYDLKAESAEASISGSGGMELNLREKLEAHITGSGSIRYEGSPRVDSSVTGSGSVRSR